MPFKTYLILIVFVSTMLSCDRNHPEPVLPQIIPIPKEQTINDGIFILKNGTGLSNEGGFKVAADFLKSFIQQGSNINLKEGQDIVFIRDESLYNSEGYILNISPSKIEIKAKSDQGAFYAVQTLRQLLPVGFENGSFQANEVAIQCVTIHDEPAFPYRGMHLDVARHMFSVDFIKKYIDALALLKMNTFHWHLTDDQGWRIEIKQYPNLQEVAAFRDETLVGHYSDQPHQFDGEKYGGFYTQEEIKDIVKYAESRAVTIIPEIEMPGHARAAIAAYTDLGCIGDSVEVAQTWGVFEDIFCAGKDSTFTFLENVLDEVVELFPSKYIHIGGDEAPKTLWKNCNNCQKRIADQGLIDEHELQNYFITRIEKYLNSKGRQIIGWDEILEGGLAPNATVMSWRGVNGAIEAAKQQHNVIMTPTSHCYFDYYQSTNPGEPLAIGGYLPLDKVYGFNPIPEGLTIKESKYVIGAQGNLWTEYIPNMEQVEYMVFPRAIAMSEVVWSGPNRKSYEDFVNRLENFNTRLEALNINYANHLYEVQGELISKEQGITYQLETISKGKDIRYTLDGTEPALESSKYKSEIPINQSLTIKAAVFNSEEQLGTEFSETINYHKAVGKQIAINVEPHRAYSGSGPQGLINGISGSNSRYGDKEWLGFWGEDIEIIIDLGEDMDINSITTRFHNGKGQWIYAPKFLEISFDDNDPEEVIIPKSDDLLVNVNIVRTIRARFIKISIPNFGIIPDGFQGSGNKAWTFIDEIIVN